jgi:methyl-galactoside transport system substrate-binding protein
MALGALDAYEKLNYTESTLPVFLGIDGTDVGLEAVRDSRLAGTVYNDKEGQASAIAKLAVALVSGKGLEQIEFENEKYIYLPYLKVTKDTVDEFIQKQRRN